MPMISGEYEFGYVKVGGLRHGINIVDFLQLALFTRYLKFRFEVQFANSFCVIKIAKELCFP